jgi:hypothetical protein
MSIYAKTVAYFRVGVWWIRPKPVPCICLVASKIDCETLVGLLGYHDPPILGEQRGAAKVAIPLPKLKSSAICTPLEQNSLHRMSASERTCPIA